MRKYTKKIHVQRLRKMLKKDNPCILCPASKRYFFNEYSILDMWTNHFTYDVRTIKKDDVCGICRTFIGLKAESKGYRRCPCDVLGKKRALQRTYEALGM